MELINGLRSRLRLNCNSIKNVRIGQAKADDWDREFLSFTFLSDLNSVLSKLGSK